MVSQGVVRGQAVNPLTSMRTVLVGVALGGALGVGLYFKGRADGQAATALQYELRLAKAATAAVTQRATVEAQNVVLQDRVASLIEEQTHAQRATDRLSRALLERLSQRDTRPATDTGQAGSAQAGHPPDRGTGAQLYREDSEFLIREAARADRLRLAYGTCVAQYHALRTALLAAGYADSTRLSPSVDTLP